MVRHAIQILSITVFISFSSLFVVQPQVAHAAVAPECNKGNFLGLPKWYKNLDVTYVNNSCSVQFDSANPGKSVAAILLAVFEILLRIAGMVAVAFVIFGGFLFITSQGEPDKAKNARTTILNALIGLAITLIAAPLVGFIAQRVVAP